MPCHRFSYVPVVHIQRIAIRKSEIHVGKMTRNDDVLLGFFILYVLLVGQRFGSWTWNNLTELPRKHAAGCFNWKGRVYTNAVGYGGTSEEMPETEMKLKLEEVFCDNLH